MQCSQHMGPPTVFVWVLNFLGWSLTLTFDVTWDQNYFHHDLKAIQNFLSNFYWHFLSISYRFWDGLADFEVFSVHPWPLEVTWGQQFSQKFVISFSLLKTNNELDSIPTFLLKLCFDELGPTIINIINFSLSKGIFPSSFKQAIVHPLLKKPSLPDDDLNNFRPISNLNFISKILEKAVVASRIQSHLYCLIPCLLHSNLPIACSIPLKPHFSVFTMTSS